MGRSPVRPIIRRPTGETRGAGLLQFSKEVISELRKVVWPSRQEATRLTIFVILIATAIGVFLGFTDLGFTQLFKSILR